MRRFKGAVLALAVSASLSATAYGGESINFGDYTAVLADDGINFFSEYNDIENVGGGYFAASNKEGGISLINGGGEVVGKYDYTYYGKAGDGLILVYGKNDGGGYGMGCINVEGELVIPCKYDYIRPFSQGLAAAAERNGDDVKLGFINQKGEEIIPFEYDNASDFTDDGLAAVEKDGLWRYIDTSDKEVFAINGCDFAFDFNNGFAMAAKGPLFGFVNKTGEFITELKYSRLGSFSEGFAAAETKDENGQWEAFYIDENGKEGQKYKNAYISDFYKGRAVIFEEEKNIVSLIDKNGNVIKRIKAQGNIVFPEHGKIQGAFYMANDGSSKYYNWDLKEISENEYSKITSLSDEYVVSDGMGNYGYFSRENGEITPCMFKWCGDFNNGFGIAFDEDMRFYIIGKK